MKLKSLQLLRALAVLLVVYGHSIVLQMRYSTSFEQDFFHHENFGAFGVDIFFIISGFIISYIAYGYSGKKKSFVFILKRFIRVNPIYYVISVLFILRFSIHPGSAFRFPSVSESTLLKTLIILPITDKTFWISPVLIVGWTLSFEWLFYIMYSGLIFLKIKYKLLCLFSIIISLIIAGVIVNTQDARFAFITNPILLEFLFGAIICWIYFHVPMGKYFCYLLILTALVWFACEILFGFGGISEMGCTINAECSRMRVLLWGIPGAMLVCGAVVMEKNGYLNKLWKSSLFQIIGDSSYSIYLTHTIVFSILGSIYIRMGNLLTPDMSVIIQLAIGTMVGILFYKFVETPLLKFLNGRMRKLESKYNINR